MDVNASSVAVCDDVGMSTCEHQTNNFLGDDSNTAPMSYRVCPVMSSACFLCRELSLVLQTFTCFGKLLLCLEHVHQEILI
jgi:hypothetical protein